MRNILAIARLAFWEGVRMRIILLFVIVLVFLLLRLPFTVRGDETVAGQLQTFLSYSLGAVGLLLGLATVFLSCSTLSNEIKNNSIQMVVTKPVTRFEILAGKWLGVNVLIFLLLLLCGTTIYTFAVLIKNRPVAFARDEVNIRDVVWQARVAAKPKPARDLEAEAREWVTSQIKQGQVFSRGEQYAIEQRVQELKNDWRTIPPGHYEVYIFEDLIPPRRADAVIQVRYRARGRPMPMSEKLSIDFAFADPDTFQQIGAWHQTRESTIDLHQFLAHGQGVIKDGRTALVIANPGPPANRVSIYLEQDDWLEMLYNIGTFEENYVKTLLIMAARLALLSALGLLFSVFVSFPVACFCVLTFYVICIGMPFWMESIGGNMEVYHVAIDPYGRFGPAFRALLVPFLKLAFPDFSYYNGTHHLIMGEYISLRLLLQTLGHTVVYGFLLLFLPGWLVFKTREIAEITV